MGFFSDLVNFSVQGKETKEVLAMKEQHNKAEKDIEEMYQGWLNRRQKEFLNYEIKNIADDAICRSMENRYGIAFLGSDFSPCDKLPDNVRYSDYMTNYIKKALADAYRILATDFMSDTSVGIYYMMKSIEPLSYFEEIRDKVIHSNKHVDYFSGKKYIRSVLTDYSDIAEGLSSLYNYGVSDENIDFVFKLLPEVQELISEERYHEAYERITGANFDKNAFEDAKKILIKSAMYIREGTDDPVLQTQFKHLRKTICMLLRFVILGKDEDGTAQRYATVIPDVIIADAIVYKRSGSIERINEDLTRFLDIGKNNLEKEQYDILRKVFAFLQTYEQESIVLEYMVKQNIPRTEEQERRLGFLRNNLSKLSHSEDSLEQEVPYEEYDGKLVYDYRSVTWNDKQVETYFNMLSAENKLAHNILVVAEWFKNLNIKSDITWDVEQAKEQISGCLTDNLGNCISCELIEASSLSGEFLEFDQVIYIHEKDDSTSKYPWLSFIVSSEQITRKQISVSIYALYIPEKDNMSIDDLIKRNQMTAAKFLSIKNKQNPKVNNYIYTVQSLLVDELENYINAGIETSSIY